MDAVDEIHANVMRRVKFPVIPFVWVVFHMISLQVDAQKINGVNLVSPKHVNDMSRMKELTNLGANWVAICPFALLEMNQTDITYNSERNWYGDREEGLRDQIRIAKKNGFRVLLKPHFWVKGEGWPGNFTPGENKWAEWEENYVTYLKWLATIAEEEEVEAFSIGTEFKHSISRRPLFWYRLIAEVREVFNGKLTYAANWDNYDKVLFWDKLDWIGIDAYFPITPQKRPEVIHFQNAWDKIARDLSQVSKRYRKPIVFTEYGYRSIEKPAWKQWLIEGIPPHQDIDTVAQRMSYQAFYKCVWDQDWLAGGFLWKWYIEEPDFDRGNNSDYTPQHKSTELIIKDWYSEP